MFTSIVYAQTSTFADSASQIYTLEELMTVGIAILLLIAIILTIVFVLWWGFLLVISGGDEHKVHPAINMIRYSLIGLIVMIVIILVTPALSRAVGFETVGEKFSPGNIFQTMKCVSDTNEEVATMILGFKRRSPSWSAVMYSEVRRFGFSASFPPRK